MSTQWTPGPWSQVPQRNGDILIARVHRTDNQMQPKAMRIVGFVMTRGDSIYEDEANARVVGAAPLMAKALRDVLRGFDKCGWPIALDKAVAAARQALAAATGEAT